MSHVVIGAGMAAPSIARHAPRSGVSVTILDTAPQGDEASFGNAGGVARIAAALPPHNGRTCSGRVSMLVEHGLPDDLHRTGALTVRESEQVFVRDSAEWLLSGGLGIGSAVELGGLDASADDKRFNPRAGSLRFTVRGCKRKAG